jgi:uncharacterized membrane protein
MQFTHERSINLDASRRQVRAHWEGADALAGRLSHIRSVAPGPADDLAHFVICLDGRHFEFAAQRTMSDDETFCWQSQGTEFLYVLCVTLMPAGGDRTRLTVTVAYDPPGFLADIGESFGLGRLFDNTLETDLHRYAEALEVRASRVPALAMAE